MTATRTQIVEKAREYIGTPFAHQGRVKGIACDCIGLPLMVAGELGLTDTSGEVLQPERYKVYSASPLGNYVHEMVSKLLERKPLRDMKPGDLLTMRVVSAACHVAIVSDYEGGLGIIHAYNGGPQRVVEHALDEVWRNRIVGCFQFPGVEN
jgi:NlpC/P60 family putative phage cell wall peptidase